MTLRSLTYIIDIDPIPWQRAGIARRHPNFHFYDKQKHDKISFGLFMKQQHANEPMFQGKPLLVEITWYMPISGTVSKRCKSIWHFKKPDIDNLEKFLLDTCTSAGIWADDCLVAKVIKQKIYDKNPRTTFTISELE